MLNILLMLVTRDTSHSSIAPYGMVTQSPFGDRLKQYQTALERSLADSGENPDVEGGGYEGYARKRVNEGWT